VKFLELWVDWRIFVVKLGDETVDFFELVFGWGACVQRGQEVRGDWGFETFID
jgi:hypothetical protein